MSPAEHADNSVRPASPADAPLIARIQSEAWADSYTQTLGAAARLDADQTEPVWRQTIEDLTHGEPGRHVFVACEGAAVVGFVAFLPSPDPDADGDIEISELRIEPRAQRRGHGSRLIAATVDVTRSTSQAKALHAWVLDGDDPRAAFLESAGMAADGAYREFWVDQGRSATERRWSSKL